MKPHTEMFEGPEAFTRFENAMKKVLSVPHAEIQRRIEEHRKEAANNPNRRGPKSRQKQRRTMIAYVSESRIEFCGSDPLVHKKEWWDLLLDELRAHHLPSYHPHGQRMAIAGGGAVPVMTFTSNTVTPDEAIRILQRRGITVEDRRVSLAPDA